MKRSCILSAVAALLAIVICILSCSCAKEPKEVSCGYSRSTNLGSGDESGADTVLAGLAFAMLGKLPNESGDNICISPFSAAMCLAMIANGAGGETRAQIEALLGMKTAALNRAFLALGDRLCADASAFSSANSLWLREGMNVYPEFLQANADNYGAEIFTSPFDDRTAKDINRWAEKKTDGMIKDLIDRLDPDALAVIVNAVCFEAMWEEKYEKDDISDGVFRCRDGTESAVKLLSSSERDYIGTPRADGFVKRYLSEDGAPAFGFVGLLPVDKNEDIFDFARSLDGGEWMDMWNKKSGAVRVKLPEFGFDYKVELKDVLAALGVTDMFDPGKADLGGIADCAMSCSRMIHQTHIEVDRNGTRAAAATAAVFDGAAMSSDKVLVFDRPFVFMIVDYATGIPLFIGVVTNI